VRQVDRKIGKKLFIMMVPLVWWITEVRCCGASNPGPGNVLKRTEYERQISFGYTKGNVLMYMSVTASWELCARAKILITTLVSDMVYFIRMSSVCFGLLYCHMRWLK